MKAGDRVEIVITRDLEASIRPISKSVDEMICKLHNPEKNPLKPAWVSILYQLVLFTPMALVFGVLR